MNRNLNRNLDNESQKNNFINELGIFELRGLARELGISSPTTRRRDELIALINERLNSGVDMESQSKSRKGRPCKTLNNIGQLVNTITGGDELTFPSSIRRVKPYDEIIAFAQETPVFSLIDEGKVDFFEGVLRISNKFGYFLDIHTQTKIYIPVEFVGKYNLKNGDFIQTDASKMNSLDQYIATKVKYINFTQAEDYFSLNLNDKTPIISTHKLPYGQFGLFEGRRNIIEYKTNIYEDDRFSNFVKKLLAEQYVVIVLGLNTSFEDSIMLSNLKGIFNFTTSYGEEIKNALDKVVDAIALANRLNEEGKRVLLFVNDIIEVLNVLDLCYESGELVMGHANESVVIAQKLISLARAYENCDLTLVLTYRDLNCDDQFLINEVLKVGKLFK